LFFVRSVVKTTLRVLLWLARHPRLVSITLYVGFLGTSAILPFLRTSTSALDATVTWGPGGPPTSHYPNPVTLSAIYAILGLVFLGTISEKFRTLSVRLCLYIEPRI
jgi:hypothetical protein